MWDQYNSGYSVTESWDHQLQIIQDSLNIKEVNMKKVLLLNNSLTSDVNNKKENWIELFRELSANHN